MHTTDAYLQHHADRTARLRSSAGQRTMHRTSTDGRRSRRSGPLARASTVRLRPRTAAGASLAGACR